MQYNDLLVKSTQWNTAIYVRISEEERTKSISDSIVNQKQILSDYAAKNGLHVVSIFEDDGFKGGNFDRPSFKRMIQFIEDGAINCVLVKDLSRFGREHIDGDHYLERYFPLKGVRFISLLERIDSAVDPERMGSIEIPLINLFNEQYLKQVSNSTKASLKIKRKEGKFVGSTVPYGYIRSPEDKHHLIIDEEPSKIVAYIFKRYLNYMNLSAIAKELNNKGILPPAAYRRTKKNLPLKDNKQWNCLSVRKILTEEIYTGDMVQGKTYSYSHKVAKREPLPRSQWAIVPNTHEAIVDKETFNTIQTLLGRHTKPTTSRKQTQPSILSGFLVCADCGKNLQRTTSTYKKTVYNKFVCSTYKKLGMDACSSHLVREDVVLDVLQTTINTLINSLVDVNNAIKNANDKEIKEKLALMINDYNKTKANNKKITKLITGLYADYKEDILSFNEYMDMKERFEERSKNLTTQTQFLSEQIENLKNNTNGDNAIIDRFKSYEGFKKLNRKILSDLVDRIIVDSDQNITIVFKFQDEIKKYCSFFETPTT